MLKLLKNSPLVKNSAWGLASNILQALFVSSFFIIVARMYSPAEFAQFLIATTVYQLMSAFSSLGLGQWFIREHELEADKATLTGRFLKIQIALGVIFYLAGIAMACIVYPEGQIRMLCILLGTNVVFDNFINAIKSLNIAEFRQQKTAAILVLDGFLKLLVGCLLFLSPFSTIVLSALMVLVRMVTLVVFVRASSSGSISFELLRRVDVPFKTMKRVVMQNWQFIIISSISIVYWRIANIMISKALTLADVANYEIASAIFSLVSIFPVIVAATVYPQLVRYGKEGDKEGLKRLYKNVFILYSLFSALCYAFIYSFGPLIIPLVFGGAYPGAVGCAREMFLTLLVLPTVLLQANLLVAIHLEKLDMWFNVISLVVNVACCAAGFYFYKSLSVVNYSILLSFVVFHLAQDAALIKKGLSTARFCLACYAGRALFVVGYQYLAPKSNPYLQFSGLLLVLAVAAFLAHITKRLNFTVQDASSAVVLKET